jgi:hypothetical protein
MPVVSIALDANDWEVVAEVLEKQVQGTEACPSMSLRVAAMKIQKGVADARRIQETSQEKK